MEGIEPKDKVKLIRGQKGGYGFEVTLIGLEDADLERLSKINKRLIQEYCS